MLMKYFLLISSFVCVLGFKSETLAVNWRGGTADSLKIATIWVCAPDYFCVKFKSIKKSTQINIDGITRFNSSQSQCWVAVREATLGPVLYDQVFKVMQETFMRDLTQINLMYDPVPNSFFTNNILVNSSNCTNELKGFSIDK